mgnify:CR=1 FL=1
MAAGAVIGGIQRQGTAALNRTQGCWIHLAAATHALGPVAAAAPVAAAEARKGYELVVEGEGVTLPVVYGRAKVGGVRSYHNTSNNFVMATANSDKVFLTPGFNINLNGRANEFLFFQQAICQGPINKIYDIPITSYMPKISDFGFRID